MVMNLIGYIRVSTDAQADNTSLGEQRERIEAYCKAFGHNLVEIYTEVGSGKNAKDRPQFQAALEAIKQADGLVSLKLDRIARNTRDVLTLVEDVLQPQNKALVLLDLNVDTSTPTGKMILTVMAAVATLERDVITERTQTGRRAKQASGGYAFGSPAYGWQSVNGELVPNEEEQGVIDLIRRHRRAGKSFNLIAGYLNSQDIKTKQGKSWSAVQISDILKKLARQTA
jgi:site-specific DNA recombinase